MKRKSTLFVLIFLFIGIGSTISQTIDKLDEKNGFKDFKLGDTYDKWKSNLIYVDSQTEGEKRYQYTGTCCQEVFTKSVEKIVLIFAKNKLICIAILLKPYQDLRGTGMPARISYPNNDYQNLITNFTLLFGKSQKVKPDLDNNLFSSNLWEAKKVILITDYFFMGDYDFSQIFVMDKAYYKKKNEDGF